MFKTKDPKCRDSLAAGGIIWTTFVVDHWATSHTKIKALTPGVHSSSGKLKCHLLFTNLSSMETFPTTMPCYFEKGYGVLFDYPVV